MPRVRRLVHRGRRMRERRLVSPLRSPNAGPRRTSPRAARQGLQVGGGVRPPDVGGVVAGPTERWAFETKERVRVRAKRRGESET